MIVKVGFVVVKYLVLGCLVGGKIRLGLIEVGRENYLVVLLFA